MEINKTIMELEDIFYFSKFFCFFGLCIGASSRSGVSASLVVIIWHSVFSLYSVQLISICQSDIYIVCLKV